MLYQEIITNVANKHHVSFEKIMSKKNTEALLMLDMKQSMNCIRVDTKNPRSNRYLTWIIPALSMP